MIRERVGGLDAPPPGRPCPVPSAAVCRLWLREKNFRRVAVFAARAGEVDLLSLLDLLPDREWYFPLVHEGRRLSFHRVCHHGELVAGSWGIREPGPGCPELHAGEMDLIVLPGAAFTRDGKRLGYGGGFYDTLLAGPAAGVPLAGVCFPCQLLDDLPMEAHDRHVDMGDCARRGCDLSGERERG